MLEAVKDITPLQVQLSQYLVDIKSETALLRKEISTIKQHSIKTNQQEIEKQFKDIIAAVKVEYIDYCRQIHTGVKNKIKKLKDHDINGTIKMTLGAQADLRDLIEDEDLKNLEIQDMTQTKITKVLKIKNFEN